MKLGLIATLMTASIGTSCAIKVQVKKDAKNSALSSTQSPSDMNLSDTKDFLRHIDGLRSTAADIIIKEMAQRDYVGAFRKSVRQYRQFMIEKSQKSISLSDSFYSDSTKNCRASGLSLNADDHNEMLGMILKTVVLAKISEADVSKINAGLAKEMQALTQFITKELGVQIEGSSEIDSKPGAKVTKGTVKLSLSPIADEGIDDDMKHADQTQVLSLTFERTLGDDSTGTFLATVDLSYEKDSQLNEATASITATRIKDNGSYVNDVLLNMGTKGSKPNYSREIIVRDDKTSTTKFDFMDILNAGRDDESRHHSTIDIKAGTQCKATIAKDSKSNELEEKTENPTLSPETKLPVPTPSQTPVQQKIPVGSTPAQVKA